MFIVVVCMWRGERAEQKFGVVCLFRDSWAVNLCVHSKSISVCMMSKRTRRCNKLVTLEWRRKGALRRGCLLRNFRRAQGTLGIVLIFNRWKS